MYGSFVEGISKKSDKYGFVNEKEIRIAAGIALFFSLLSIYFVIFKGNFNLGFFTVGLIFIDFVLKVFIGPDFSIFGRITRFFLENKEKNMVGSVQKRFAWSIGVILSTFVIFCMLVLSGNIEVNSPKVISIMEQISTNIANNSLIILPMNPAIIACIICVIFMFLESIFGICVGCKIYKFLVKKGIMKKIPGQNCVNGACEI